MKKANLTETIDGIKYVVFEPLVQSEKNVKDLDKRLKEFNGIYQGVVKIHQGFFTKTYTILRVLIPEQHAINFSKTH